MTELRRGSAWVRLGLGLVIAVYVTYSSFGIAGPLLWGHHGYHAGIYMARARTSLRFNLVTPTSGVGFEKPPRNATYLHHPIGYHHVLTLAIPILGEKEWVPRGVAAAGGLLVLWALIVLVRRWWSPRAALLASAVYVGLPILCSFSVLSDPMLPAMACSIATVHVFLRYLERPAARWIAWACVFIVVGGLLMWEAYFQAFFHGLFALAWLTTRRGRERVARLPAGLAWFLFSGACAVAMMAFHLIYTWKIGMFPDFLESFQLRHDAGFDYVVTQHKRWLEILYGWFVVYLGLVWIVVFLIRAALKRLRARDQAVLIFCLINVLYIFLFAEGSAVHLYRVFWFSTFFALAITDLIVDLHGLCRWALGRFPRFARVAAGTLAGVATAAYFFVETPHAYRNLLESRVMMGTHGLPNYSAAYPVIRFGMEAARRYDQDYFFLIHNIPWRRFEFHYYVDRSHEAIGSLHHVARLAAKHPHAVLLSAYPPPPGERAVLRELMARHPAYLFDRQFLLVDLSSDQPEFSEYDFLPEKPSWVWTWFYSHKYPPLRTRRSFGTASLCTLAALRLPPPLDAPEPPRPARNQLEQQICYHNYLVLRGRAQAARDYLAELLRGPASRAAALPGLGRVVSLRNVGRKGADAWILLDRAPGKSLRFVWRVERVGPTGSARLVRLQSQTPAGDPSPWEMATGYLYVEPLRWSLPPGQYRLRLELTDKPPLPGPVVERGRVGVDLGRIDVR